MIKNIFKKIWFEILFFIANGLVMILFYKNINLTTMLLGIVALVGLFKWNSFRTFCIFIVAGIAFPFLEVSATYFGVWSYSIKNFINIPFWLFIAWGNGGAFIYQVAKNFREKIGLTNKLDNEDLTQ